MEILLSNVPFAIDEAQLRQELIPILHGRAFGAYIGETPYNFLVRLFKRNGPRQGSHSGKGVLIVPLQGIGERLLQLSTTTKLRVHNRELTVKRSQTQVRKEDIEWLQGVTSLESPTSEVEIKLRNVEFGWPHHDGRISIEWESPIGYSWGIDVDVEARRFIVTSQDEGISIAIASNNVQSMAVTLDACILRLFRPPVFECEKSSEREEHDGQPTRDRLIGLDSREYLFGLLRTIRLTFTSHLGLEDFRSRAKRIGHKMYWTNYDIPARGLFDTLIINQFHSWISKIPFNIAFQIDGLLSRGRFNPKELLQMSADVHAAMQTYGETITCNCIKSLEQCREENGFGKSEDPTPGGEEHREELPASSLFKNILRNVADGCKRNPFGQSDELKGGFRCHRVRVTPTSLVLSGPLADETNRVLRKYIKYQSNFLRVEFRDEDRLHLRLDRDVDSAKFIDERFGTILREGLVIAGRKFEFLAYSSSALREHAVWFINPFDGDEGRVDAESIRNNLGDFGKVIKCPARYGARIAQAFSATEPSVTIMVEEEQEIPDKQTTSGSLFTDGVGTMSPALAAEIWKLYTEPRSKQSRSRLPHPSVIQIRFGGLKGILSVDERIEGRVMRTRPSMRKFTATDRTVEIARVFDRPATMYLNRWLIMLLETLGVPKEHFMDLQQDAIEETEAASKSMKSASQLLEKHGLGSAFHMPSILLNLHKLNVGLQSETEDMHFISFIKRLIGFGVNHVLRDLKYKARIPVPNAWVLVGVADEYDYLEAGEIYANVLTIDGQNEYIDGPVLISRSPTVHPGDVQMVRAIGRPPSSAPAGLERLTNCVVFSCKGTRSLPSMLAGGDLDGDIYCLVMDPRLHPKQSHPPAPYPEKPELAELSRPSTASDIVQFVIDFMKNDLLGVIALQILLTADDSPHCMDDPDCLLLAALHSQAVDYAKTGKPVVYQQLPKRKRKENPDWHARETDERKSSYESNRIIGHLFRAIELPATREAERVAKNQHKQINRESVKVQQQAVMDAYLRNDDLISQLVKGRIDEFVDRNHNSGANISGEILEMLDIYNRYADELSFTCRHRSLSNRTPLTEEEVVAGTIVAKSSQPRTRQDMITDMRRDSSSLATFVREEIEGPADIAYENTIMRAWSAWKVSMVSYDAFGARSFGLMALDIIFGTIRKIDAAGR